MQREIDTDKLNPLAKEHLAKSLVDLGNAIYKGAFLSVLVLPITLIIESILASEDYQPTLIELAKQIPFSYIALLIALFGGALAAAHKVRRASLYMLHDLEIVK